MDHFRDDVLPQRPFDVGRGGQRGTAQEELTVRVHGHEGEDLERPVDEAGAQEVVDGQGPLVVMIPWTVAHEYEKQCCAS